MTLPVSPVEAVLRGYGCDRCGALPGDRCTSRGGVSLAYSHADRFYRARADGALPLGDDEAQS